MSYHARNTDIKLCYRDQALPRSSSPTVVMPITLVGVHILQEAPWEDYIGSHYVLGAVDDLDVVETVGFLNSSFPHSTNKKLLQLKNEFSKAAGYKRKKNQCTKIICDSIH